MDTGALSADYSLYEKVEKVPGWLHKVTAHRTLDLLAWQRDSGIVGGFLEIGVFCGKYFALLLDSAARSDRPALGIDTFQFTNEKRVHTEMKKIFGQEIARRYTLWRSPSSAITPEEVIEAVGRPVFISVDGAHDYENVYRDLVLAEATLGRDGIIAADDFINPLALGVNQAVNAFLATPRSVVPVAYIANKLFLAHRSREADYREALEASIMKGAEPQSVKFRDNVARGRHFVEQDFHGHKVLLS